MKSLFLTLRFCLVLPAITLFAGLEVQAQSSLWKSFIDPKDGKFDASNWLIERSGFLPVPVIVSDPAVGYGGGLAVLFFHESEEDSQKSVEDDVLTLPPSVSFGAGIYTENESWAGAGGHFGSWKEDSIRYLGYLGGGSLNLKYFGAGLSSDTDSNPLEFNIDALFLFQELTVRYPRASDFFFGANYTYMGSNTTFDDRLDDLPGIDDNELDSNDAGIGLVARHDSRDIIISPNSGFFNELILTHNNTIFGGDFNYWKVKAQSLSWWQLTGKLNLGVRFDGRYATEEAPFYAVPFIDMRGIPALRYQGDFVFVSEIEPRYDLTDRWSLVGFVGSGWTASEDDTDVEYSGKVAGGGGIRYLIARRLGMRMGVDVAWGPEDTVVYLTVGSHWR